ncbi:MAG: ATP-binding cassette domain-containing protein [Alphaproteobacteria bacterium]|nr:ATP-binding cassette domain-containing protein [Alphaproteobacteria bacterium]
MPPVSKVAMGNWPRAHDGKSKPKLRDLIGLVKEIVWSKNPAERRPGLLILIAVLLVADKVFVIGLPFVYGALIDNLGIGMEVALPLGLVLAYGLFRVADTVLDNVMDMLMDRVSLRAIRRVTTDVYGHILRLPLAYHLDNRKGGLAQSVERGTRALEELANVVLLSFVPIIIELLIAYVLLATRYDLWSAGILAVTMVCYLSAVVLFDRVRSRLVGRVNESEDRVSDLIVEGLSYAETVKTFAAEDRQAEAVDGAMEEYRGRALKVSVYFMIRQVTIAVILSGSLITLLAITVPKVSAGALTVGGFVALAALILRLFQPLRGLGIVNRRILDSLRHTERMMSLFEVPNTIHDKASAPDLVPGDGSLAFEGVTFDYASKGTVLRDLSFVVPGGKTTALVGPTGAGKSTIQKLLLRLYDPDKGSILIDGQDIRDVRLRSARDALGVVPQDCVLFHDTIDANIRYARPEASMDEVREAARMAAFSTFVEGLPMGYETIVGDRGLKLSGGERQRLAIARAYLKNPRIFILDEATSSLDSGTEAEIVRNFAHAGEGRTQLIIAHRLSTVMHADQILVLDNGSLVERGTHDELLALDGLYAGLWQRQTEQQSA